MALTLHPVTGNLTTVFLLDAEKQRDLREQAIYALDRKYAAINAANARDAEKWRKHVKRIAAKRRSAKTN